jgi:hypothetical protein
VDLHFMRSKEWRRLMHIHGQLYLCERMRVPYGKRGALVARSAELLRIRLNNSHPLQPTAEDPTIACAGPGYISFTLAEGTTEMYVAMESPTGWFTIQKQGGVPGIFDLSTFLTEPGTYCMWISDEFGEPVIGAMEDALVNYLEFEGSFSNDVLTSLDLSGVNCTQIDLANTGLTTLPAVHHMTMLEVLSFNNCPVTMVPYLIGTKVSILAGKGCALTEFSVDQTFTYLGQIALAFSITGGNVQLDLGTNAAPTTASLASRNYLLAQGYVVDHN